MKCFPFAFILVLVLSGCSGSKKNETSSLDNLKPDESNHRLAINVTLDGSLSEWPEPLPGYSKETTLHFGVTNDKDFLFIAVACNEETMQRKMMRAGMEIYISENDKKETTTGITFPLPSVKQNRQPENGEMAPPQSTKEFTATRSERLTQLQTFGFKKIPDSTYPLSNQNGLRVAYSRTDNNFFNIEYAIPLKEIFTNVAAVNNSNIRIGFKLNGFGNRENNHRTGTYATGSNGNGMNGGMRGGGMRGGGMRAGGMRGGGMRGGGMRQGGQGANNNMSEMSKDQSFWTKYTIS